MSRTKRNITEADVARNGYPRQVAARCGCMVTVFNKADAEMARQVDCMACVYDRMRTDALRDRRLLRGPGRR